MCKQWKTHIHVMKNENQVAFTTTCSDCFQKLLKHPDIVNQLTTQHT